jgi:Kef-type K+ transport system membrane component KefB
MGIDWNTAFVLGALMNTRGLMELIALNVGYDLGVISPEIFTALALMALVTTALTGPWTWHSRGPSSRRNRRCTARGVRSVDASRRPVARYRAPRGLSRF